ncbi:MAG TPA: hydrogenase maturation nickel metallochaperone HypA [Gemmatimonadales bacterium]|jgi:hydrogenase nickel incorporation protein HypA/HybF|nr:hydrogenase maturation nickel metallochaperone HypA [Gemmatimonadales bacterium]
MHELSVAIGMVDMATAEAERLDGEVLALHLKLGPLAGVVREALEFAFELARVDTPLAASLLVIEEVPVSVYCGACGREQVLEPPHWLMCPDCGAPTPDVRHGRECELVALEMTE